MGRDDADRLRHANAPVTLRAAFLALALAAPAAAQSPEPRAASGWSGQALHHVDTFRADRPAWSETRVALQRRGPAGAVGVELARVERNGRADATVAADLYRVLSRRLYANVRVEGAPRADVVPALSVLAEAYAAVGGAWEASAGVRYLAVPGPDVPLATASVNRTAGAVVVGLRTTAALRPTLTVSTALTARYLPEASGRGVPTRASLTVGQGQEAVVGADGAVAVRRQFVVAASGQRAVGGPVGVLGGVAYTADGALTRWSAEGGVAVRF